MSSAARDAQHFKQARTALRALVAAGSSGVTGKALLGDSWKGARWGYMLLRRLEQTGIVRASAGGGGSGNLKLFFPTDELAEIVEDDEELGALLWPGSHAEPEVIDDEDEPVAAAPDFDAPLPEPSAEPMEALVQMSATILENVVYMREKLDALGAQMAELRKVWE